MFSQTFAILLRTNNGYHLPSYLIVNLNQRTHKTCFHAKQISFDRMTNKKEIGIHIHTYMPYTNLALSKHKSVRAIVNIRYQVGMNS